MNFSRIPIRSRFGRLARLLLTLIPPETVVRIVQGPLKGRKWIVGSGNHGCWLGSYEMPKQKRFSELVKGSGVVFDVGAHVGFYSLLSTVLTRPNSRIFAFEPLPRNVAYLRRHIDLNNCPNVSVVEAAVTDTCGVASFDNMRSSYTGRLDPTSEFNVKTVTLNAFSDEIKALPDCIKIDIEGAEHLALLGAQGLLEACHPILFVATHGAETRRLCCDLLTDIGYHLEALSEKPNATPENSNEIVAFV